MLIPGSANMVMKYTNNPKMKVIMDMTIIILYYKNGYTNITVPTIEIRYKLKKITNYR